MTLDQAIAIVEDHLSTGGWEEDGTRTNQFPEEYRAWCTVKAEIERLTADRQALLDAANKTAELVMRQGQQSIEQQAEIERLEAERSEVLKWLRQDRPTKALRVLTEAGDDNAAR